MKTMTNEAKFAKLKMMTRKLYDARTPANVRRDLSFEVSMLRSQLGSCSLESMSAASMEEEHGS